MKLEEELLEQYFDVIEKNGNTENQIQEFLEENTIFIPMPFLLNHYLHMSEMPSMSAYLNLFYQSKRLLYQSMEYPSKDFWLPYKMSVFYQNLLYARQNLIFPYFYK